MDTCDVDAQWACVDWIENTAIDESFADICADTNNCECVWDE